MKKTLNLKITFALVLMIGVLACSYTSKKKVPSYLKGYEDLYAENPREATKEWFRDARIGLFIHYGLYSQLKGYYGNIHSKPAEWVQLRGRIPVKEYEKLADTFTAENFNTDNITDLAVDAGMKYINITTRHHDSFCLFDSEFTTLISNVLRMAKIEFFLCSQNPYKLFFRIHLNTI